MDKKDKYGLTIAGRMEFVRRLLEFTRKEWAEELNLSLHVVENMEYGKQKVTGEVLAAISDKFPYVVNYILTGEAEVIFSDEEKKFLQSLESFDPKEVKEILNSKQKKRF